MKKITLVALYFIFSSFYLIAQEKVVLNKMIEEVTFLASDQLEGRETGTQGERIAAKYIEYKLYSKFYKFYSKIINIEENKSNY